MIVYGIDHIPYEYPDDYAERCQANVLACRQDVPPGSLAMATAMEAAADLLRLRERPGHFGLHVSPCTPRQLYEPPPQTLSEWEENVRKAREARTE